MREQKKIAIDSESLKYLLLLLACILDRANIVHLLLHLVPVEYNPYTLASNDADLRIPPILHCQAYAGPVSSYLFSRERKTTPGIANEFMLMVGHSKMVQKLIHEVGAQTLCQALVDCRCSEMSARLIANALTKKRCSRESVRWALIDKTLPVIEDGIVRCYILYPFLRRLQFNPIFRDAVLSIAWLDLHEDEEFFPLMPDFVRDRQKEACVVM